MDEFWQISCLFHKESASMCRRGRKTLVLMRTDRSWNNVDSIRREKKQHTLWKKKKAGEQTTKYASSIKQMSKICSTCDLVGLRTEIFIPTAVRYMVELHQSKEFSASKKWASQSSKCPIRQEWELETDLGFSRSLVEMMYACYSTGMNTL